MSTPDPCHRHGRDLPRVQSPAHLLAHGLRPRLAAQRRPVRCVCRTLSAQPPALVVVVLLHRCLVRPRLDVSPQTSTCSIDFSGCGAPFITRTCCVHRGAHPCVHPCVHPFVQPRVYTPVYTPVHTPSSRPRVYTPVYTPSSRPRVSQFSLCSFLTKVLINIIIMKCLVKNGQHFYQTMFSLLLTREWLPTTQGSHIAIP